MSGSTPRVIVVLGYSDGGRGELHPIGAARLARAAEISTADDVVVLSGWARVAGTQSEAHLMEAAWAVRAAELVVDPDARTTVGNALQRARRHSPRRGAGGGRRHLSLARSPSQGGIPPSALAAIASRVRRRSRPSRRTSVAVVRELPLWALLPAQLWHSGATRLVGLDGSTGRTCSG